MLSEKVPEKHFGSTWFDYSKQARVHVIRLCPKIQKKWMEASIVWFVYIMKASVLVWPSPPPPPPTLTSPGP